jgi:hypothetical protein
MNTVLQKQDFPTPLKTLNESIVNNAGGNLKSGFKESGIYPCDASPLLGKTCYWD